MNTKTINVCLSCDDNYAKHAGVTIASILANANKEDILHFYILDGGISEQSKQNLLALNNIKDCDITFIKINEDDFNEYKKVQTHFYISLPSFYRLKLASLLPDIDRIIYFDCDFVICTSLSELFNKELDGNIIAGVSDTDKRKLKKNPSYINSGMIVFDLANIRKNNIEQEFLNWTINNIERITLGDQQIINEVLKGKIKLVESEWNVQSSNFINRSSYTKHPKAIHILAKPWIYATASVHKKEYFKYLQLTPWALNEEEYKHWTTDNEKASIIAYIKRRPLFFLRPRFYYAIYKTYLCK